MTPVKITGKITWDLTEYEIIVVRVTYTYNDKILLPDSTKPLPDPKCFIN